MNDNTTGSIVRAAIAASGASPGMTNLLASTRSMFRRRTETGDQISASISAGSSTPARRGRRRRDTFSRQVFLMKLAHANFLPACYEQTYLKRRGLGKIGPIVINRNWGIDRLKAEMTELFQANIGDLLSMSDFVFAKADKKKRLHILTAISALQIEQQLGNGMLVVIPLRDFPNDLPIVDARNPNRTIGELSSDSDFEERTPVTRIQDRASRSGSTLSTPVLEANTNVLSQDVDSTSDITALNTYESDNNDNDVIQLNILDNDLAYPVLNETAHLQYIEVSRDDVYRTMLQLYADDNIIKKNVMVRFIGEPGVDAGGLTSELFTIFWQTLFSNASHFNGNDILVPHLPLHLMRKKKADYELFGRILSHAILLTKHIPTKLAKFTVIALAAADPTSYKNEFLLKEYLGFLTLPERKLVIKGLNKFEELKDTEKSRLEAMFMSNNFMDLPRSEQFRDQILLIAEKVIIKDPADLYQEMKKGLPEEIIVFFKSLSLDVINTMWNKMKPTPDKVMNCLKVTCDYVTNAQEKTFFYLQNYVGSLNDDLLSDFLLFITASVNMPESISISFHQQKGLGRRPIAHTCSNSLELADNYDTQQEFNVEFDKYLKNESTYQYDQV